MADVNSARLLTIVGLFALLAPASARAQLDLAPLSPLAPLAPLAPLSPAKPEAKKPPRPARPKPEAARPKPQPDQLKLRGPVVPLHPGESTTVRISVLDQFSKPIAAKLALSAARGTVTAPVETAPGQYLATYAAPANAEPGGSTTLKADVKGAAKPVSATLKISFAGSEAPALVSLVAAPKDEPRPQVRPARIVFKEKGEVRPGGSVLLRFRVLDDQGQPLPLEGVELKAEHGELSAPEESGTSYVVRYVPNDQGRGEIAIHASARGEPLTGEGIVLVHEPGTVAEQSRVGLDITAFAGGLTNFGKVSSPQFELAIEYALGRALRLGVLGGFSPAGAKAVQENGGSRQADFALSIIPLLARAGYNGPIGPVDLGFGGMAGVALVSGEVSAGGAVQEFSAKPLALGLFANLGLPVGPGEALVELRMTRIQLDYQDPQVEVKGGLGGLSGAVGYRLEL